VQVTGYAAQAGGDLEQLQSGCWTGVGAQQVQGLFSDSDLIAGRRRPISQQSLKTVNRQPIQVRLE
jgi:hypothetical protein